MLIWRLSRRQLAQDTGVERIRDSTKRAKTVWIVPAKVVMA